MSSVLKVEDLSVRIVQKKKQHLLLDNVSFEVREGECLGILGESGSGKSITAKSVLGLLDGNFEMEGRATFKGQNLLQQNKEALRRLRGKEISMVLQNPMTCFDPLYKVGDQITETLLAHEYMDKAAIHSYAIEILEKMKIREPREALQKYPHQLSGGMLQRIMIGLALSMEPKLLIADEPTTAIDAITQYDIMKEFRRIKEEQGTVMVFISHDLSAISYVADRIIVLNKGKIVDEGSFEEILFNAKDPYTRLLIEKRKAVMQRYRHFMQNKEALA